MKRPYEVKIPVVRAALVVPLLWSAGLRARGRDPRLRPIRALERCAQHKKCKRKQMLRGATALKDWQHAQRRMAKRKIAVKRLRPVKRVPARWRAQWNQRWGKTARTLAAAGFRRKALARLGSGQAVVTIKPRVALALAALDMTRGARTKTEYMFLVLWRVNRRWYVSYFEDSPRKVILFLTSNAPR